MLQVAWARGRKLIDIAPGAKTDLNEPLNGFMLVDGDIFLNKINLILKYYDMLETHDFHSS